jgi:replicative DNA helicase
MSTVPVIDRSVQQAHASDLGKCLCATLARSAPGRSNHLRMPLTSAQRCSYGVSDHHWSVAGLGLERCVAAGNRLGAERVDHATLTLGLAVQPVVLRELAKVPAARDKGLLGRILYSWPEDFVGRRQIDPPTTPNHLLDTYTDNLTTLTRTLAEWTDPAVLTLTPDADRLRHDLQAATEPRLAATGQWAHLRDWGSKWVGHVARIAGLLHLADHLRDGWTRNIDATTWQRAQAIGEYFATHAETVFDHMGADPTLEDARVLLGWIERNRVESFTARDAHRANRPRLQTADVVAAALNVLEDHNHVRQSEAKQRQGPGRKPSPTYFVHPQYRTSRER